MITVVVGDYTYAVKINSDDAIIYSPLKSHNVYVGVDRYRWREVTPRQAEALTGFHYPAAMDYLRECVHDGVNITRDLEHVEQTYSSSGKR